MIESDHLDSHELDIEQQLTPAPTECAIGRAHGWIDTARRRPEPGALIVKRWRKSGAVWAGVYSGTDKDSSFDEWYALPVGVKGGGDGP